MKAAATYRRAPAASGTPPEWDLRLYIAGQTPRSLAAVTNLRTLCEAHLAGRYRIEVVDLLTRPQRSRDDEIVALPTLVRRSPAPSCKIVGDLCDAKRTLRRLQLLP